MTLHDLSTKLEEFLNSETPERAQEFFDSPAYDEVFREHKKQIINIITPFLTAHNAAKNPQLIQCCENVLLKIAQKHCSTDLILEFLEEVECSNGDALKFCTILKPLTECLCKTQDINATVWVLGTIKLYVEDLPVPEDEIPEEEGENLADADSVVTRIIEVYKAILDFLCHIILDVVINSKTATPELRNHLLSFMLSLMGKPFCFLQPKLLHLPVSSKKNESLIESIVSTMGLLSGDLLRFLQFVDDRNKNIKLPESTELEDNVNSEIFHFGYEDKISNLAYAHFYYCLLGTESLQKFIPQVYHPHYIMHTCFYLSNCLIKTSKCMLISKGLELMKYILDLVDSQSVGCDALELDVHTKLLKSITKVMISCDSNELRKTALTRLHDYFKILTLSARYHTLLYLYKTVDHSGLFGVITGIFKSSITMALDETPPYTAFTGERLGVLLKLACKLQHGCNTDLVEVSDEVIAVLNLLRFLLIRDKDNTTGIWDFMHGLEIDYLKPLREGIHLSRAHWHVKIKDLQEESKRAKGVPEVTLTVGGEPLPRMSVKDKLTMSYQVLTTFDVMESILVRVNECISSNKPTQPMKT
ncbi:glomulin isoform X1 [Orussus abietinus]|uniref:glomulin isoform X1 n=1 Tax=Orussus abietinus TaxID=222816 RepID=UPI0006255CE8|nr:glomulin isoform X1 [Orussus abietinus]XP_012284178.1 glomulin isoform X1 [Orussus abietinus]